MRNPLVRLSCRLALIALAAAAIAADTARAQAPAASLDQILKEISSYDGGIESQAVWKLRDYVQARKDDPAARAACEPQLIAFLKTPATMAAKMAVGRALRLIATEQAVPALQALLGDERVFDVALYALQQIPGASVDKALLAAVGQPKMTIATRTSLVAALGARRSANAVTVLVPLLKQTDLAVPAATALGAIGNAAASQALVSAYPGAQGALKPVLASSLLQCAENAIASKDLSGALRLYDTVAADASLSVPYKRAVALGRLTASGTSATTLLMGYLQGTDGVLQEAAISRLQAIVPKDGIAPICALLPRLPEASQIKLLAVLPEYPKSAVMPVILDRARSQSDPVRIAAFKALGSIGGAGEVAVLSAQAASAVSAPEQAAARAALGALKGREVDAAILSLVGHGPPEDVQAELLTAIADRRIYAAKPAVVTLLASRSSRLRLAALRSLRAIGTPSDMAAVLDVMGKSGDESESAEAGRTIAALAQKIANADSRSSAVRSAITAETNPVLRARYIGLLPLLGDNSALPLLRRTLETTDVDLYDAAVRALAAWPTPAAREDVLELARDAKNETHRLLAITGLIRIITLDRHRDAKMVVADLRQASGFAWRPEEQKLILGALGGFPCREALEMARTFLREPALAAEAEAAVKQLEAALKVKT